MVKVPVKKGKRGAGRPAAAEVAKHKEAILLAAEQVFLEKGFESATMGLIAERAGSSKGTLYALYPSKGDLFAGIVQRRIAARVSEADRERLISLDQPIQQALESFAIDLLGWIGSEEARRWQQLVVLESGRFPELSQLFWKSGPAIGIENLTVCLKKASERGLLQVANPREAAHQFIGITVGIHYIRNGLGMDPLVRTAPAIASWVKAAVAVYLKGYGWKGEHTSINHNNKK
jgi:AcrR family transcriptional regulator